MLKSHSIIPASLHPANNDIDLLIEEHTGWTEANNFALSMAIGPPIDATAEADCDTGDPWRDDDRGDGFNSRGYGAGSGAHYDPMGD